MEKAQRTSLWMKVYRNRVAYAYIAPFYILFLIFGLFPMVAGLSVSFFSWNGLDSLRFVGIQNYARLMNDALFWKSMVNTAVIGIVSHVFILGGGLLLAFLLNSQFVKFRGVFKAIYFLPMVTSAVATALVFKSFFGTNAGLTNFVLQGLGLEAVDWWGGDGGLVKVPIVILFSWQWIGWNMVIYLAGMQAINPELYEAATIDGAGSYHVFTRITVPLLTPVILFTVIQSTIGTMGLFTEPFIMAGGGGGTDNQGLTAMMFLLNKAPYGGNLYGYASATAYLITVIIVVVSIVNMTLFDRDVTDSKRRTAR